MTVFFFLERSTVTIKKTLPFQSCAPLSSRSTNYPSSPLFGHAPWARTGHESVWRVWPPHPWSVMARVQSQTSCPRNGDRQCCSTGFRKKSITFSARLTVTIGPPRLLPELLGQRDRRVHVQRKPEHRREAGAASGRAPRPPGRGDGPDGGGGLLPLQHPGDPQQQLHRRIHVALLREAARKRKVARYAGCARPRDHGHPEALPRPVRGVEAPGQGSAHGSTLRRPEGLHGGTVVFNFASRPHSGEAASSVYHIYQALAVRARSVVRVHEFQCRTNSGICEFCLNY